MTLLAAASAGVLASDVSCRGPCLPGDERNYAGSPPDDPRQHGAHEIKSPLLPPSYALIRSGSIDAAGPLPIPHATSRAGTEQSRTAGLPDEAGTAPNTAHRCSGVQESFERVSTHSGDVRLAFSGSR